MPDAPAPTAAAPSRVRYAVLGLLCLLAMMTYMDRALLSNAQTELTAAISTPESPVTVADIFLVTAAFQFAYACFEIPMGWLGDRYGPRGALLRVVLWWSAFVALTGFTGYSLGGSGGLVFGFGALVGVQFLFGIGEAGAFPNITKSISNWFPPAGRGTAQGAVWMSARLMGGLTPVVYILLNHPSLGGLDWRTIFWGFAAVAVLWCVAFGLIFRNSPAEHPDVNAAELAVVAEGRDPHAADSHAGVPWRRIFGSRNVLMLCLMYAVCNFNWYFLLYDLSNLMKQRFPVSTPAEKIGVALLAGLPLIVGMAGCFLGGRLTDLHLRRTGDRKWARRTYGMLGYGLAGVFYLGAAVSTALAPDNLWLLAGFCMAVGFSNDLMMAPSWATAQDIGGRYSGIVSGAMNMLGNFGAVTGRLVSLWIIKLLTDPATGDATPSLVARFVLYAAVYAVGVGVWLLIDPTKRVDAAGD